MAMRRRRSRSPFEQPLWPQLAGLLALTLSACDSWKHFQVCDGALASVSANGQTNPISRHLALIETEQNDERPGERRAPANKEQPFGE